MVCPTRVLTREPTKHTFVVTVEFYRDNYLPKLVTSIAVHISECSAQKTRNASMSSSLPCDSSSMHCLNGSGGVVIVTGLSLQFEALRISSIPIRCSMVRVLV